MTTGYIHTGDSLTSFEYEKGWSGVDRAWSESLSTEHAYSMYAKKRASSGTVLRCGYGCTGCIPVAGTYPKMQDYSAVPSQEWIDLYQRARFKALMKLVEAIRGHDLDLGNALGEAGQTLGMAANAVRRISSAARALKRADADGVLRALGGGHVGAKSRVENLTGKRAKALTQGDISDAHLAMTYGVVPLLSDVFESATAMAVLNDKAREFDYRAHGVERAEIANAAESPSYYIYPAKLKVSVEIRLTLREHLSASRSLGLLDPVGVAWELVPYSFIADWFIPIGSYLDALSILPHLNIERAWQSTLTKQVGSPTTTIYPYGCEWKKGYSFAQLEQTETFVRMAREATSVGDIPFPRFKPLSKALSPAHLKNGVALLHKALLGISRP